MSEIEEYYKGNIHVDFEEELDYRKEYEKLEKKYEELQEKHDILQHTLEENIKYQKKLKEENKHYHTLSIVAKGKQKVLQERIDKATEYIEKEFSNFFMSMDFKTLLEILKGEDK